jgi:hypothetical protein
VYLAWFDLLVIAVLEIVVAEIVVVEIVGIVGGFVGNWKTVQIG